MRRFLGAVAGAMLVLTVAAGPAAAAWPAQYSDVDTWPDWASVRVGPGGDGGYTYMGGVLPESVWWELMVGDRPQLPDDLRSFRPNDNISRAEYAAVVARALGLGANKGDSGDWYQPYVDALAQRHILPDAGGDWPAAITRQEMGRWIGRSATWYGLQPTKPERNFPDLVGVTGAQEIELASRLGVITGYPDGTYHPDATATRTEAAAMVLRLAKMLNKHAPSVEELAQVVVEQDRNLGISNRATAGSGTADLSALAKTSTDSLLYGPGGLLAETLAVRRGRPWWGWNEPVGELRVQGYLVRDTVAILGLSVNMKSHHADGSISGTVHWEGIRYLTRVDGTWKLSNGKRLDEFDDPHRPVPEMTTIVTIPLA